MADFDSAIAVLLADEGELANSTNDHGGLTKWGISSRAFPEIDIANLTKEQAVDLYRHNYWTAIFDQIDSQAIATKLLVMAANMGLIWAVMLHQRALNVLGRLVVQDGIFGPQTLEQTNAIDADRLLLELKTQGVLHYAKILERDPSQDQWAHGWIRRQIA